MTTEISVMYGSEKVNNVQFFLVHPGQEHFVW